MAEWVIKGSLKGPQGEQGEPGTDAELPAGGTEGQVLTKTEDGAEWQDAQGGGSSPLDAWPVGSLYMSLGSTSPQELFGGVWEKVEGRFLLCADSSHEAGSTGGSNDAVVVSHTHSGTAASSGSHTHSATADSAGSHNHSISGGSHSHSASSSSAGGHTHSPSTGDSDYAVIAGSGQARLAGPEYKTPYYYVKQGTTRSSGSHTHTITVSTSPSHSHTVGSGGSHDHDVTVSSSGSHSHTVTVDSEGESAAGKNMPAYLAVNVWQRTA